MGMKAEIIVKPIKVAEMKTKSQIVKGLAVLLLFIASTVGAMAQTITTPTQDVCPGTEPYLIHPSHKSNLFLWTISEGASGIDWTISLPTDTITNIIWTNPATPQTYTVLFKELDVVTDCYDEVNLKVTVNPKPDAPVSGGDIVQCEELPIQTLTATATAPSGSTVVWYDVAIDGTVVPSPTLSAVGTITYYAESVVSISGCTSLTRTPVTLTIDPAPVAPTASDEVVCSDGTLIQTLTATAAAPAGATVVWYDASTAGTLVAAPTQVGVGTVTYYAESVSTLGSCPSLTRTPVILTINTLPLATIAYSGTPYCTTGTASVTHTGQTGGMYSSTAGLTIDSTTGAIDLATSTPGTYLVTYSFTDGTCTNTTTGSITINALPVATIVYSGTPFCATGTASVTFTGQADGTYSSTAGLTIDVTNGEIDLAASTVGTYTITYSFTDGICVTTTTTSVTVNPVPNTSSIFHN